MGLLSGKSDSRAMWTFATGPTGHYLTRNRVIELPARVTLRFSQHAKAQGPSMHLPYPIPTNEVNWSRCHDPGCSLFLLSTLTDSASRKPCDARLRRAGS